MAKVSNQLNHDVAPARVIFNFLTRCNMDCKFCYLDFGEPRTSIAEWIRIIDRIAMLGVKSITFAGGDPFMHRDFLHLLRHAKSEARFSFIQVDTNGLCVSPTHYSVIRDSCDLLGLPLDGSNNAMNAEIRSNHEHYEKVLVLLRELGESGVKIKINTVVNRKNLHDVIKIAELLKRFKVKIWSLYEFWPQGPAAAHAFEYSISEAEFMEVANRISESTSFAKVEIGSIESRKPSYFFVSHSGRVYTINPRNAAELFPLGNVFDSNIVQKWNAKADRIHGEFRLALRIRHLH